MASGQAPVERKLGRTYGTALLIARALTPGTSATCEGYTFEMLANGLITVNGSIPDASLARQPGYEGAIATINQSWLANSKA